MTALPPSTDITVPSTTEGAAKTWFNNVRAFLSELLGTDGDFKTARAALRVPFGCGYQWVGAALTLNDTHNGKTLASNSGVVITLPSAPTGPYFVVIAALLGPVVVARNGRPIDTAAADVTLQAGESAIFYYVDDTNGWVTWLRSRAATVVPYPISVANGGTGATNAAAALANLGASPAHSHPYVSLYSGLNELGTCVLALNCTTTAYGAGSYIGGGSLLPWYAGEYRTKTASLAGNLSGTWVCLGYAPGRYMFSDPTEYMFYATLWKKIAN